jgi:hypothetical protein
MYLTVRQVVGLAFHFFLAVFADLTKSALEGAALEPTLFIFSPEPPAMRFCLALMFAYSPGLFILESYGYIKNVVFFVLVVLLISASG